MRALLLLALAAGCASAPGPKLETIAADRGLTIVASAGMRGIWPRPETGSGVGLA